MVNGAMFLLFRRRVKGRFCNEGRKTAETSWFSG
jgi:hypothetical protein